MSRFSLMIIPYDQRVPDSQGVCDIVKPDEKHVKTMLRSGMDSKLFCFVSEFLEGSLCEEFFTKNNMYTANGYFNKDVVHSLCELLKKQYSADPAPAIAPSRSF